MSEETFAPISKVQRPAKVRLVGDEVVTWEGPLSERAVPSDLLDRFRRLRDEQPKAIEHFAETVSVLQLCDDHNLPRSHAPRGVPPEPFTHPDIYACPASRHESVELWQQYAAQVQAIINVAARLQEQAEPRAFDLATMRTGPIRVRRDDLRTTRDGQRQELARLIRAYLAVGDVRPGIVWGETSPTPRIEFRGGLFGAIALALMQKVSGVLRVAFCQECGRDYVPQRMPKPGEMNFCKEHRGSAVRQKHFARRARERRSK